MKLALALLGVAAAVSAGVLVANVITDRRQRRAHLAAIAQKGKASHEHR